MNSTETPAPPTVLMQLTMGLWSAQLIGSLARLQVFDQLGAGPKSAATIAETLGLNSDAIARALRACVMIGVCEPRENRTYALSQVGQFLRSDVPGSMRAFVAAETAPGHWLPWGQLEQSLKSGKSQVQATLGTDAWSYYGAHPDEALLFSQAMAGMSAMAVHAISQSPFRAPAARQVVDVGGAHGAFLAYILQQLPDAKGVLYDLAHVIESAPPALAKAGIQARVQCQVGDFFTSVPQGGDLYLLKHILHDWNDERCLTILDNVRKAMAKDATIVVVEMLIPEDNSPSPALLLDLNMLVMLEGRERTASEMRQLLAQAGLTMTHITPTASPFSVIEARAK